MATPDTSILKGLSKDRQANLAAIAKQAQEDPEYGINSLKLMLDELKALSPAQRRLRFGFEQDDLFKIASIRQKIVQKTDKAQITDGFYFPGKQGKIAEARQIRKAGYEKASKEEAEYQSGLNKRTPLEKLGVGLRAGFEGYIAPAMVRAYEERGLPMEDALGYIDFRDPLQAGAATAGFSYGQNLIPGATSIPGNLLGGAIGGGLGTAIGRRVLGGAAAGWAGGLGGLVGGMGGAMATSALGQRFLNPITGVSDPGKAMLSERFSGPERAIGNVLAPAGLFSVMQGPRGARTFFEGDQGMRGALTSLATNPASAVASKVVSPFVDAASRIVQVNQTQNDISAANEEARRKFREENGYEGSEEELVNYGYTRPSERLNQALMDASLGGFGRLGNVLSGESFFSGMRDRAMAKEAKKVMGEIEKGAGAAGTIPTQTTRTAPFGVIKTAVPRKSEGGAGRVPYPVSIAFDEGDKPNFRVKDTTATLLPTVQRSMTSEFKKPQPVPVMDGSGATMDVIGLAPSGEVFVLTQDLAKNNVVQTRLYSDLPKVLQERVDRIARRTVSEGATVPDFTAVSDTGYAATQDAYKGFQRTFPNTVTVDGVDVNARILTVDDDDALVELPSGSTFYVPKDFVNAKSGKKIELGEQRTARDFAAARDSKGNPVFTELTIDGEKTRVFVDESNRAQAVNPSIFLDSKTGETANPDAVGTLVDMGELRFGETAKAREQGVVVGVDTFKVGDEDASGYWVQSLNDPSARPFLVAQTAVQVAAKTPNAGATKVDPAVVTKLKKKLEELIDGESGLKDLINKHKSRVLENLIKDIEAGENSINKSPVTEDDVVRGFENIRNEVSKKDAISQFNELQEDFKKRVLEPYAEEVAGDSVITSDNDKRKADIQEILRYVGNFVDRKSSFDDLISQYKQFIDDMELRAKGIRDAKEGLARRRADENRRLAEKERKAADMATKLEAAIADAKKTEAWSALSSTEKGQITRQVNALVAAFKDKKTDDDRFTKADELLGRLQEMIDAELSDDEKAERKRLADEADARRRADEEEAARKRAEEEEAERKRKEEEEAAARKRAEDDEAARKRAEDDEKPKEEEPEEAPAPWPKDYEFSYGERFGEVARDEDLPEEMRSDRRGGEEYRYRRMTAGEQVERRGDISSLPERFMGALTALTGQIKGVVIGREQKQIDVDVTLRSITNRDQFEIALKDVYGQTDDQAKALANVVDRFATGWSLEMMRLSGINTQDVYRAVRNSTDPKGFGVEEMKWKVVFREQSVLRNDEETLKTLKKLQAYYYTKRLGNISALNAAQVQQIQSVGFTKGWYGNNGQIVNIAFALAGKENYVAQVHEVTHLLMKSMYAPMYHQLAAAVMPAYGVSRAEFSFDDKEAGNFKRIDSWVEERMVTSFLRALVTNAPVNGVSPNILSESMREGGATFDMSINKTLNDLGYQLREAAKLMQGKNDLAGQQQNILGEQGFIVPLPRTPEGNVSGYYPTGTSFRVQGNKKDQVLELVLSEPWDALAEPNKQLQGNVIDGNNKVVSTRGLRVTKDQIIGIGQLRATFGLPFSTTGALKTPSTQGITPLSATAQSVFSQFFGHWAEHTENLLRSVDIDPVGTEVFVPDSPAEIRRYLVGYKWFKTPTDYRNAMDVTEAEFSDNRVNARIRQSYLGWLDAGGFDEYLSEDQIRRLELGLSEVIESGTAVDSQAEDDVLEVAEIEDFMSTPVPDEKPKRAPVAKSVYREMSEGLIARYLRDLLKKGKDITEESPVTGQNILIDKIMGLPFIRSSVTKKYTKAGLDIAAKPYYRYAPIKDLKTTLLSQATRALLNRVYEKFDFVPDEDSPDEMGHVQLVKLMLSGEAKNAYNAQRLVRVRIDNVASREFKYALQGTKPVATFADARKDAVDENGNVVQILFPATDDDYKDKNWRDKRRIAAYQAIYNDLDLGKTLDLEDKTEPVLDSEGNPIPVIDKFGLPVMVEDLDRKLQPRLDADGNIKYKPVYQYRVVKAGLLASGKNIKDKQTVLEQFRESAPAWMSDDDVYEQYLRRVAIRDSEQFKAEQRSNIDSIVSRGMDAKVSLDQAKTAALYAELKQALGYEANRLRLAKYKVNNRGVFMLPFSLFKESEAQQSGANLDDLVRLQNEIRSFNYTAQVLVDGQPKEFDFVYNYTVGTTHKPGYSKTAFLANHAEQLRRLVESGYVTESQAGLEQVDSAKLFEVLQDAEDAGAQIELSKESSALNTAYAMFNLGYVELEKLGIRTEDVSANLLQGEDTKQTVFVGLQGALKSVIQFARPHGNNYRVLVYKDGINTWKVVTPETLAEMLMTSASRGIERSIVAIRDSQRVPQPIDIQRTLPAQVRHFVTGIADGIDADQFTSAEITYTAAINAVNNKRRGTGASKNKQLPMVSIDKLRVGGDAKHWSGPIGEGQQVIAQLKKAIDGLIDNYAGVDAGEHYQSFIALLNEELLKPQYRFIPAIADYQFRIEMAQRGESLIQEVQNAVRVDYTNDAKKPYSVSFADVTAPTATQVKKAEESISKLVVQERTQELSIDELIAIQRDPTEPTFAEQLIEDLVTGRIEERELVDRNVSNLRKFKEESSSESFRKEILDRIISARWHDYVKAWANAKLADGRTNREALPDLFVKLNVEYSDFKARLENSRTFKLRDVAGQAAQQRQDLNELEKAEEKVRDSSQQIFDSVIGDIDAMVQQVGEGNIAALLNIAQKSKILDTAPVYGKMSAESLMGVFGQFYDEIGKNPQILNFIKQNVADYESLSKSPERIAKFMNAMSGMAVALRTVANVNSANVLIDSPAVVELLPSLTLRETAVLRVIQASQLLGTFNASQTKIADLLGIAPASVKETVKTLVEKINSAEMQSIVSKITYNTKPTATQKLTNSFVTLASVDNIVALMPDDMTLTQRIGTVMKTLLNSKAIMDDNPEIEPILQKVNSNIKLSEEEQKIWNKAKDVQLLNAIRLKALDSMHYLGQAEDLHGVLSGVARIVNEASVLKTPEDIVEYDSQGRLVTVGQTSDALPSASEMSNAIKKAMKTADGTLIHISKFTTGRNINMYDVLIKSINRNLPESNERTYLTNAELRQVVMTNIEGISPTTIKATLQELMSLRDNAILDPLKDKLKGLNVNEVSMGQINDQMEAMELSIEDRVVAMSTLMNAATRQNEPKLVAWMIAEKRLPSFEEYLEIKGNPTSEEAVKTAEKNYKDLQDLQKSLGLNAIIDGVVGTQISMQEREKARTSDMVSFNFDIRPQDLPLTEAMAMSSIAYQQSIIDEFVSEETTFEQLTADSLKTALDNLRGVITETSPLKALPVPGAARDVVAGSARRPESLAKDLSQQLSKIEDTSEQRNVRMARLAARVLRNGVDAIRDAFLIAEQKQQSIGDLNPFFSRISQRNLEAAWTRKSALDALSLSDRKVVGSLLDNFAKHLTRGILDSRLSWLAATKQNETLDSLTYEVYDHKANVVSATDLEGRLQYLIDFTNAKVVDEKGGQGEFISASKSVPTYVPSVDTNGNNIDINYRITPAQRALYDLLSVGLTKDQLRKNDTAKQIMQIVLGNEALRSVPPVYWHAKTRVTDRRPDAQDMEPMFLSTPMKSPVDVYNSVGTIDEDTRRKYVFPVLTKWLAPDETGLQRVVRNNNNEPFFDGEGYTVWRADGKRSHIYAMLIDHGLTPNKALEIYALTENPVFKDWAEGDRIESALLASPGSFFSQGRVRNAAVKKIVYQGLAAQNLVTAIDRFMASPSDKNFDDFAFAYDEVDAFGAGVSDEDMVKLMMEIKNSPDRKLRMGIIRDKAEAMVATASTPEASSIFMSYKAYKDSEQEVRTGKPFHTLAFAHTTNSFLDYSAPGVGIFDLGSGLHTNGNRKNRPSWIKFKNPLVHNLHDANVTQELLKDLIQKAMSKGYDGIVLSNVVDTVNDPVRRNLAITLNDANIMPVSRMTRPTNAKRVAKATDIEPMFLSTPMYAPVTSNVVPPLLQGAGKIRELTTGEKAKNFGWYILDNMMSFARNPLSSDFAFSFIQAGKAFGGLAPWSWRPQDFVAWWRAAFGSLQGMAPNLQITIAGKKIGYDKLGRRQWIKVYQNLRQDETWEIMKALNVPMHFMNFERRLESERVRMYTQAQGTVKFEDIKIDMLAYDERGNLDDAFERNTLTSMMPMSGMFERQMSLQHDLLMFYQIRWQLNNNPEFKDLMTKADPVKEFSKSKSAKAMVNFIANSMGDFQYTTNDKVDIVASRLGKVFLMAPRWYMANIAIAYPAALVADNLYKHSPKYRKFVGAGNRSIGLYAHENKELKNYQLKVYFGTMMSWVIASIAAMIYGRLSRNPSVDWITTKGLGQFRIGNWEISESTGTLDFGNTLYNTFREVGRGGIGTKPRIGETTEEAENAGFSRVWQRLSYKKSPFISLYYDKLFRGRDALNNIVYRPNEEFLYLWEDVFRNTINPALKASGMKELAVEDVLFTSKIATQQVPTAWQQIWETYSNASREELGRKDIASRTAGLAWLWSALGTRVQYRPFVPAEMQQLYSKQWVFKRFIEQQGRSGYDIMKEEGFNDWLDMLKHGKM